jgi:hypothetical protein
MTIDELVINVITAAISSPTIVTADRAGCFHCNPVRTDKGDNVPILVLEMLLTRDEYEMLGILLRREINPDIELPQYRKSTQAEGFDGCFDASIVIRFLPDIIRRDDGRGQWSRLQRAWLSCDHFVRH